MLAVTFRIRRAGALNRVTAQHPQARLAVWCNLTSDAVEVQAPTGAEVEAVKAQLLRAHAHARPLADDPRSPVVVMDCPARAASVTRAVEGHGGFLLPPVLCQAGWDTFRLFLPAPRRLAPLMKQVQGLGEVEILAKKETEATSLEALFLLSATELLGSLTRRQSETLLTALQHGYYSVPRRATMQEIARRVGRPRTSMEEQLRRAEGTILQALAPVVALRQHGQRGAVRRSRRL